LDGAVVGGDITDSGFIFRGRIANATDPAMRTVRTFYQVENGQLRFLEDWPQIDNLQGRVVVNDGQIDINGTGAEIAGMALGPARGTIRRLEQGEGAWLSLFTSSRTTSAAGLNFLRNTP